MPAISLLEQLTDALAGTYAIEREIGRGGMATVYLARDLKHERNVAVKVLDPELGAVLGADRFIAEIKVTANLQHPNLLPLFDSGAAGGLLYYVMPFVEGESLRSRLEREKQLPVDEAVRVAAAIANALDYAHAHGVIHRDLKPENVLMQAGEPIVADFGIALAVSRAGGARVTQTGLSLGTPQYMSPEQAMGDRALDGRSDIYALGAIAYEMLTGEPPHTGSTSQAIVARLLTESPRPIRVTRPSVPEHVDAAVLRALEKLPADRWSTAGEFRSALLGRGGGTTTRTRSATTRPTRRLTSALALVAAIMTAAFLTLFVMRLREPRPTITRLRFTLPADDIASLSDKALNQYQTPFALSDDGTMLAYVAQDSIGARYLWIRAFDQAAPRRIAGTEGADAPFWSPDGKSVGFFAGGKIFRYDLSEAAPTVVADIGGEPGGAAWMATGDIVASRTEGPLLLVPSHGGAIRSITQLDSARGELEHVLPERLPDGRHFLYTAESYRSEFNGGLVYVSSVDGGKPTLVHRGDGIYAAPNRFLVERDAGLVALSFDPHHFTVGSDEQTILSGEPVGPLSASANGTIAWLTTGAQFSTSLELVNRAGHTRRILGAPQSGVSHMYFAPRLSPDGRTVAAEHHLGQGGGDIYMFDVATGAARRETFDPTNHSGFIAWSPDGKRIVFNTTRAGGGTIFMKTIGVADDKLFVAATASSWPSDWSRDDRSILFDRTSPTTQSDVWLAPVNGGSPRPILAGPSNEMQAVFSPDGKWIAYASDEENGRYNVYVRPFPLTAEQWKVSENGGEAPRWRGDGKELFFLVRNDNDASVMSSAIRADGGFHAAKPVELFRRPIVFAGGSLRTGVYYDVTADGSAFVMSLMMQTKLPTGSGLQVFVHAIH